MIQKEKDDEARISCIMKIFRFNRCTNEVCKKIYTSGKIECGEGVGQAKKQDRLCESCAGFECKTHKDPEKMVKKCEFCCNQATFSCYVPPTWFCTPCHEFMDAQRDNPNCVYPEVKKCEGEDKCPFQGKHKPNAYDTKHSFCALCREEALDK